MRCLKAPACSRDHDERLGGRALLPIENTGNDGVGIDARRRTSAIACHTSRRSVPRVSKRLRSSELSD